MVEAGGGFNPGDFFCHVGASVLIMGVSQNKKMKYRLRSKSSELCNQHPFFFLGSKKYQMEVLKNSKFFFFALFFSPLF